MNDVTQKMKQLIGELNAASKTYYSGNTQHMSDAIWNAKFDELEALEMQYDIVLPCSPTQNISHEVILGQKVVHEYPALSLPKSKSKDAVIKWVQGKDVNLSWKLDGMTIVATYDDGKLTRIVTRGNGEEGSDITHLADAISNLQKTISDKGHVVIRSEAVISYDDFVSINEKYNNAYENPRNLVAGSLNPLTQVDLIMDRCIKMIPFTLVHVDRDILLWKDRMKYLETLGFEVVPFETLKATEVSDAIDRWSDDVVNAKYPVDGLVVVYDDVEFAAGGTSTGRYNTRGGFAYKWADETAETELIDIEWSVSINSINPVAIFKPVRLEGTTVQRASLFNISECERLGIGDVGTKLVVIKANKIIPNIISATTVGKLVVPKRCPVCDSLTTIKRGSHDTKVLCCTNENCSAKQLSKLDRFVSKYGFNIMGLSERTIMDLINKKLVKSPIDILTLIDRSDDVYSLLSNEDGWGNKSIDNMLMSIKKAKTVTMEKFLYSLCIPMCGRDISKKLAKKYDMNTLMDTIKTDLKENTLRVFSGLDGIGDVKSSSFFDWFSVPENLKFVEELLTYCTVESNVSSNNDILTGKTFVITGSLNHYSSRDVLKELIESLGGKVSGAVSSKTSYLINNDITSTFGKNMKAKELNIPIISEDDFISMFIDKE